MFRIMEQCLQINYTTNDLWMFLILLICLYKQLITSGGIWLFQKLCESVKNESVKAWHTPGEWKFYTGKNKIK